MIYDGVEYYAVLRIVLLVGARHGGATKPAAEEAAEDNLKRALRAFGSEVAWHDVEFKEVIDFERD